MNNLRKNTIRTLITTIVKCLKLVLIAVWLGAVYTCIWGDYYIGIKIGLTSLVTYIFINYIHRLLHTSSLIEKKSKNKGKLEDSGFNSRINKAINNAN